ncbi:unnamed protein product, partial [Vitis vinifera]
MVFISLLILINTAAGRQNRTMGPSNIRDLLTTFTPSLDFFAISSGDGRIKILQIAPA